MYYKFFSPVEKLKMRLILMSSFKSPVDTAKTVSSIGGTKSSANVLNVILLSFLAGAYIAFGGLLAEVAMQECSQQVVLLDYLNLYLVQCSLLV